MKTQRYFYFFLWDSELVLIFVVRYIHRDMRNPSKNCLSGNNSTQQPTAQPSEMGKYSTPELQAAFNSGREIGRTEGMLYYIKHASENMQKEAEKLNSKLQEQKAKV